jgi:hypothetical protein
MKRDLLVIILFSLLAVAFAVILFLKNQKDKKELENKLNTDYKNPGTIMKILRQRTKIKFDRFSSKTSSIAVLIFQSPSFAFFH